MEPPEILNLGRMEYREALAQQLRRWQLARDGGPDALLLVEHPPVITLGRHADRSHVLLADDELARRGIALEATDRGGDVTLHAPGQVVVYPILDLRRRRLGPVRLVAALEAAMVRTVAEFGVCASAVPGRPGVWVDGRPPRKIGAVGLRISEGVSRHGLALNVCNDLDLYRLIVPCGLADAGVTSLERETGRSADPSAVADRLIAVLLAALAGEGGE